MSTWFIIFGREGSAIIFLIGLSYYFYYFRTMNFKSMSFNTYYLFKIKINLKILLIKQMRIKFRLYIASSSKIIIMKFITNFIIMRGK